MESSNKLIKGDKVTFTGSLSNFQFTSGKIYTVVNSGGDNTREFHYAYILNDSRKMYDVFDRRGVLRPEFSKVVETERGLLETNTLPFKDLSTELKKQLICAYLNGEEVEFRYKGESKWDSKGSYLHITFFSDTIYRLKPKEDPNAEELKKVEELKKQLEELESIIKNREGV